MPPKYKAVPTKEGKASRKKTPTFAAFRDEEPQASPPSLHDHAFHDDADALLTTQPWEALASSRKRTLHEGENGSHPNLQSLEVDDEDSLGEEDDDNDSQSNEVDAPLAPMPKAVWFILGTLLFF